MADAFRFHTSVFQPSTILVLLMAFAVANLWRKRRETRRRLIPLTVLLFVLPLLSTPAMARWALKSLESQYPPLNQRPDDAGAIVVLAGGVTLPDETGCAAQLDADSLMRCRQAADLYQRGPACPVLLSGGTVDRKAAGPSFAQVMREYVLQLNVPASDIVVEEVSRTTFENATESYKLLELRGIRKIVLVTDAIHMPRALVCFRKQGLQVIPAPCHFQAGRSDGSIHDYLPNPDAACSCQDAVHEWLGTAWYWLRGRI